MRFSRKNMTCSALLVLQDVPIAIHVAKPSVRSRYGGMLEVTAARWYTGDYPFYIARACSPHTAETISLRTIESDPVKALIAREKMARENTKEIVYYYTFINDTGETVRPRRPGTLEAIKNTRIASATPLTNTALEVDEADLDEVGFYPRAS